jgi:hypothetical protein
MFKTVSLPKSLFSIAYHVPELTLFVAVLTFLWISWRSLPFGLSAIGKFREPPSRLALECCVKGGALIFGVGHFDVRSSASCFPA